MNPRKPLNPLNPLRSLQSHAVLGASYFAQFLKSRMEYRVDFLAGLTATIILQLIGLVFIEVIFLKIPTLNGWSRPQVFFIYGLTLLPTSLFSAFFTNLYMFSSHYIVDGNFDRILLRPLNSLFQVCLERVRIEALSGLLTGALVIAYASALLEPPLAWTAGRVALLVLFVLSGTTIMVGLFVGCTSLSFWFVDRIGLLPPLYNVMAFGRYPLNIYDPRIQWVLTWILPFAFLGFFPATLFLDQPGWRMQVLMTPVVAAGSLAVGFALWNRGLRRYESTGS